MQSNGKAENTIAKAMHRDARQCNAMEWFRMEWFRTVQNRSGMA